eukprot:TRINITY_DN15069_c0_g1_i1.p1 TRINITY_DN15069_c0_g1~~TRINITY_DN15069_c0_g1_i1.p1  ORF type:complete len:784 (+),score=224.83 TRINITY_DN15069_c0_g1_i1:108-2459(+)
MASRRTITPTPPAWTSFERPVERPPSASPVRPGTSGGLGSTPLPPISPSRPPSAHRLPPSPVAAKIPAPKTPLCLTGSAIATGSASVLDLRSIPAPSMILPPSPLSRRSSVGVYAAALPDIAPQTPPRALSPPAAHAPASSPIDSSELQTPVQSPANTEPEFDLITVEASTTFLTGTTLEEQRRKKLFDEERARRERDVLEQERLAEEKREREEKERAKIKADEEARVAKLAEEEDRRRNEEFKRQAREDQQRREAADKRAKQEAEEARLRDNELRRQREFERQQREEAQRKAQADEERARLQARAPRDAGMHLLFTRAIELRMAVKHASEIGSSQLFSIQQQLLGVLQDVSARLGITPLNRAHRLQASAGVREHIGTDAYPLAIVQALAASQLPSAVAVLNIIDTATLTIQDRLEYLSYGSDEQRQEAAAVLKQQLAPLDVNWEEFEHALLREAATPTLLEKDSLTAAVLAERGLTSDEAMAMAAPPAKAAALADAVASRRESFLFTVARLCQALTRHEVKFEEYLLSIAAETREHLQGNPVMRLAASTVFRSYSAIRGLLATMPKQATLNTVHTAALQHALEELIHEWKLFQTLFDDDTLLELATHACCGLAMARTLDVPLQTVKLQQLTGQRQGAPVPSPVVLARLAAAHSVREQGKLLSADQSTAQITVMKCDERVAKRLFALANSDLQRVLKVLSLEKLNLTGGATPASTAPSSVATRPSSRYGRSSPSPAVFMENDEIVMWLDTAATPVQMEHAERWRKVMDIASKLANQVMFGGDS